MSKRQREIAELVAQGYSNRQIADMLFIAESTVKNALCVVYDKLEYDLQPGHVHRVALALEWVGEYGE